MAAPTAEIGALAMACADGDLAAFEPSAGLGWTLSAAVREALLRIVEDSQAREDPILAAFPENSSDWWTWSFTIADLIAVIHEAATNESGIAVSAISSLAGGKNVAIAFRHGGQVHLGVRYGPKSPVNPGHLWPELRPWFKQIERNRPHLEVWKDQASDNLVLPLVPVARTRDPGGPTGAQLLAAVIAEPDDVARRLVYADWLVEQGDAQGELIHLCERLRTDGYRGNGLQRQISDAVKQYGHQIAGEIGQLARRYTFGDGFVSTVVMSAPTFAKHGERLLEIHPIRTLELASVNSKSLSRLAHAPAVRKLRGLEVRQTIGHQRPMPLAWLYETTEYHWLRELAIHDWITEEPVVDGFSRWSAPQLRSLVLCNVDSAHQILAGIAHNTTARLQTLAVTGSASGAGPAAVFRGPAFAKLRELRLFVEGSESMLEDLDLPEMRAMEVRHRGASAIQLPGLRSVDLLGPVDATTIFEWCAQNPLLSNVRATEITGSEVDRVFKRVLSSPESPLRVLTLPTQDADAELADRVRARLNSIRGGTYS